MGPWLDRHRFVLLITSWQRPTFWQCSSFKLLEFSTTMSRLISRKWELNILHKNTLLVCHTVLIIVLGEGSFYAPICPHLELLCHQYNVKCLCLQVVTKIRNCRYSEFSSIPALLSSRSKLPKRWRRKKTLSKQNSVFFYIRIFLGCMKILLYLLLCSFFCLSLAITQTKSHKAFVFRQTCY